MNVTMALWGLVVVLLVSTAAVHPWTYARKLQGKRVAVPRIAEDAKPEDYPTVAEIREIRPTDEILKALYLDVSVLWFAYIAAVALGLAIVGAIFANLETLWFAVPTLVVLGIGQHLKEDVKNALS